MNVVFSENIDTLKTENFEKLKLKLGLKEHSEFGEEAFNLLVNKLDSLNIKDEQLIDGYEWSGGQAGFRSYLDKNIDILLKYFNSESSKFDNLINETIPDSVSINKEILVGQDFIKSIQDSLAKKSLNDVDETVQTNESKKSLFSGLRVGSGIGKSLIKGTLLSNHSAYFESCFSIRTPVGINIGPFMTRIGYESTGYSFESSDNLSKSYFGSGSGAVINIDLSKIIKIGGQNIIKEFIIGKLVYDHGAGITMGYNLNLLMGKLPFSISVSTRFNMINFSDGSGSTFFGIFSADLGLDLK